MGSFPETGYNYSTSYSMDEVANIATYYLYTGDLSFVRTEWPMVTRELAYDASLVDNRGLLDTDGSDGQDWDYYDGSKAGEVTAYNDIYYRTLTSVASLADALGLRREGAADQRAATNLRAAINRYLFDPATGSTSCPTWRRMPSPKTATRSPSSSVLRPRPTTPASWPP